jgi:hypothetical protein
MFSLRNRTTKRLNKRATATIESWKKKNGREPTMADIHSLHALGPFERVSFIIVGGIFVWISLLLLTDAWIFPCLLLPVSGYVAIRGIIGHKLKLTLGDYAVLATPDNLVASAENELTSLGRKLLALDICFITLLIIIEVVCALIGSLASALG